MSVRLVVTDDHPIMRQALAGYFSRVEEMEVVGQATNGREAVELVDQLRCHGRSSDSVSGDCPRCC